MKLISLFLLPTLSAAAMADSIAESNNTFFLKAGLGIGSAEEHHLTGIDITGTSNAEDLNDRFTTKTGYSSYFAIGKNFTDEYSGEIEMSYQNFGFKKFSDNGDSLNAKSGSINYISLMFNGVYRPSFFNAQQFINPYLGLGIGISQVSWSDLKVEDATNSIDNISTVQSRQIFIGNSFPIKENINLDIEYRYFETDNYDYQLIASDYSNISVSGSSAQSILLTLSSSF